MNPASPTPQPTPASAPPAKPVLPRELERKFNRGPEFHQKNTGLHRPSTIRGHPHGRGR